MSVAEIKAILPLTAFVLFGDASYEVVPSRWLTTTVAAHHFDMRVKQGLHRYSGKNDCDDFVRSFAQAAQDLYATSTGQDGPQAVAVGEFWYINDTTNLPHCVVVAVDKKEGLFFICAQKHYRITLSPKEIASCYFVRF